MFERRLYHHIDWAMVGAIVALCLIGLAQIYSTTSPAEGGASGIFFTQIWGILLGLVALAIVLGFDYRSLADKSHFLYVGIVALLVGVLIIAGLWLAVEGIDPTYRGNGTPFPSP